MTLDTYADLFDDDLDAVAVTLHARYSPECAQNVPTACPRGAAANMKTAIYQRKHPHRVGAGGGTRTLKLFRAPAPKAGAVANFATPACLAIVPCRSSPNLSVARRPIHRPEGVMGPADELRSTV
jgi:hypothetical protein